MPDQTATSDTPVAPVAPAPVADPVANHPAVVAATAALATAHAQAITELNALTATKTQAAKANAYDSIAAHVASQVASVNSVASSLLAKDEAKLTKWVSAHKVDTALIAVALVGALGLGAYFVL